MLSKPREFIRRIWTQLKWVLRIARPPWRQPSLDVWSVAGGLGDELMALGVVQAAERATPSCVITFHARHVAVMPRSTARLRIVVYEQGKLPADGTGLIYLARHQLSIIDQMALQMGLRLSSHSISIPRRPDREIPPSFPKDEQVVVVQTVASAWTPNKQWPRESWKQLIELLDPQLVVVEIGTDSIFEAPPCHPRFLSLVGRTSLLQFAACIQEATVFLGPPSGGMHLAHAYQIPSVVIIGGYEGPYPYPLAEQICTTVACAPCWLRTPCPHDWKCLHQITPETVKNAVERALKSVP